MSPLVSVVIGFRDWGLPRVKMAAQSIQNSFGPFEGEVILSDYGSTRPEENRALANELGLKYVFNEDEVWSRSRALNAGLAVAEGQLFVSTDADMIFSPQAFERICEIFLSDPGSAYFLQCRDLPEGMDDSVVRGMPDQWDQFERVSRLRPRWGMGGMMAISREGFTKIRGFDERLHTYGGEDIDFAKRATRAGYRTNWIEDPSVRMYHVWHPPTRAVVEQSAEGAAAIAFNKSVYFNDKTFVRNWSQWQHPLPDSPPLVTIAICTKNRSQLLRETLLSIRLQTIQDFEVIVVDDGGEDDTRAVVEEMKDERFHYQWIEGRGISAARNVILDLSRGQYTAVIDDDDLMHPQRLEWHLEALMPETRGNVGSFLNFDDATGKTAVFISMLPTIANTVDKGGAPGHGTWFVETDTLRRFRYDETITSGVDNNLWLRMLRSGVQFGHTGKTVTLRRMHNLQVTATDSAAQGAAAKDSHGYFAWTLSRWAIEKIVNERKGSEYPQVDRAEMLAAARPYLPDRLVSRDVTIENVDFAIEGSFDGKLTSSTVWLDGAIAQATGTITHASYADLLRLRSLGLSFTASEHNNEATSSTPSSGMSSLYSTLAPLLRKKGDHSGEFLALIDLAYSARYQRQTGKPPSSVRILTETEDSSFGVDLVDSALAIALLGSIPGIRFLGKTFL